jgi:hypothetical protein
MLHCTANLLVRSITQEGTPGYPIWLLGEKKGVVSRNHPLVRLRECRETLLFAIMPS